MRSNGAIAALGILRAADALAQFHQRLIEGARVTRRQPIIRDSPQLFPRRGLTDVLIQIQQARENADHIAIKNRDRAPKGDAGDGAGGIGSDAGQLEQSLDLRRHFAAELARNDVGGAMQIAGAAVISQAFP